MALDGIFLHYFVDELKPSLIGAKIDKINQPEKDEIILTLRTSGENKKFLISASSKHPRFHFTKEPKANPLKAPMFLMVLRKYLSSGKIVDVTQYKNDRIITLHVEAMDELGFNSLYKLVIEIMGRHSNITLIRDRDNKIMECIKHISSDVNSYRVLFPGVTYVFPPDSNKLDPFNFNKDELTEIYREKSIELDKNMFFNLFTGISKLLSSEMFDIYSKNTADNSIDTISDFTINYFKNLDSQIKFLLFKDNDEFKDFYITSIKNYMNLYCEEFQDPSELLELFFKGKDKQDRIKSKSSGLQKIINTNIERCNKKLSILTSTLDECKKKDSYKIKGDLLTAYIYSIKKGDNSIKLLNFYNENEEEYLDIDLDTNKTPSENVQYYYKKYNKLKKSEENALEQLSKNDEELEYLKSVLSNLENSEQYSDIDDIKKELIETGYIKFKKNPKDKKDKATKPLHFISSDGLDIFVGKNNIQNDYLTLKFAHKEDTWLHTKEIPGSHVIIKGGNVPDSTLREAANLAAYYSKGKLSSNIPIDYTKVKYVKKPNSAKPGMVIYTNNKTLYVNPSEPNLIRK
ncbi:Rqc2 family fibronectin-binding protein [Clostridium sp. 'White wine YQ']|uniref:Rqc2 family fibronectin-binding protein n=1 Tax=Clostridium sp. 'White wine YQ' TaxID=3027474 RepID=UPI0023653EB6|nr:NFACT RNA binding domain-containing protein [Clostridium sp. 'White wine YQ']MDD7793959.1 NFACT RNA binding domain-containing protein [Clostridium sp. 'White wine YQ']